MKSLFICHYIYIVTPKGEPRQNIKRGIKEYSERAYVEIQSEKTPTETEIRDYITAEWKRKGIGNYNISEIFTPEKIGH